ncbi:hypothetical protein AMJ87_14080 [candidate division WOR_3 bacterium SM23_60]|uniref:Uncharacterized protein n=1 Tax=candidate division WOR_3 bacterium SM23_60 TaxID=1703780 RepID=A0A0S8G342_UNCW3|nr:MAG: hypothetical protein AMJ87_14080 [candidate division WOR_3 bacterium SM23_60]
MVTWAFIVFAYGLILFIFYVFNLFTSVAPWIWSIILFVVALGMLNRIWTKEKEGEKEKLAAMVAELENKLEQKGDIGVEET